MAPGRPDSTDGPLRRPAPVLARQRRARILEAVQQAGGVRVSELTTVLGVSDMTIRRDLDAMAKQGLLEKVHGGATATDRPSTEEPSFESKSVREQLEKDAIAAEAAKLVQAGCALGLSAGSTTWVLAHHLLDVPQLTVVTNSVRVADVLHLHHRPDRTVILVGGLRTPSDALVGPVAVATIRSLHIDLLFMGVHGCDARAGLTSPNLMEAETDRAFTRATRQLIVVADHTKWGIIGLSEIVPLSEVDTFITDDGLAPEAQRLIRDEVGELVVAKAGRRVDRT